MDTNDITNKICKIIEQSFGNGTFDNDRVVMDVLESIKFGEAIYLLRTDIQIYVDYLREDFIEASIKDNVLGSPPFINFYRGSMEDEDEEEKIIVNDKTEMSEKRKLNIQWDD